MFTKKFFFLYFAQVFFYYHREFTFGNMLLIRGNYIKNRYCNSTYILFLIRKFNEKEGSEITEKRFCKKFDDIYIHNNKWRLYY